MVAFQFCRISLGLLRTTPKCIKRSLTSSSKTTCNFKSIEYSTRDQVAYITLNRPQALNAIDACMPAEIEQAVGLANNDDDTRVIVISGSGRAFCSGYDLRLFTENESGEFEATQKMPWDPYKDYRWMHSATESFMSLWRSLKPTVCKVHGNAIAGGSDIALCCDLVVMAEDALIGYPPTRVWGCPTTAMWAYRVGAEKAKRLLLTGDVISGNEAARIGLVGQAVSSDKLDEEVARLVQRMTTVPTNQLFFQKQVINQVVEQMGLSATQRLATLLDGMTRHTPEGVAFQKRAGAVGFKQAVKERDEGTVDWTAESKH